MGRDGFLRSLKNCVNTIDFWSDSDSIYVVYKEFDPKTIFRRKYRHEVLWSVTDSNGVIYLQTL